jgi:nucleoside-diphosphate-sugar epimerase
MRILVAGCGYLGQAAADLFHGDGWEVEGWTKSPNELEKPYPVIPVDISDRAQVNARPENFDFVIHATSTRGGDVDLYRRTYLEGARNLLDRFVGSTILFVSSTSVYAQRDGDWVTEDSPAEPAHERGQILRKTEKLVLANGGIVARLAGIYGPNRSALLRKFLNGEAVVNEDRFVNQIHRDDAAAALRFLLDRQLPGDRIFNVADNEPMLLSECYRWLATKLGRDAPSQTGVRSTSSPRKRGESNKRVSNAKLRGLGWQPQFPSFRDGMEKSVLGAHAVSR